MTAPASSTQSDRPIVDLRDVHLQFGDTHVLSGVQLAVQRGDRLVVLGQSGGGKSTILRLALGILKPTRGQVLFDGTDLARLSRRRLNRARQRVGMVYQYSALISSLTVRENLALPLEELTDKSRGEINQLVEEKLELVGMTDSIDKMPAQLSGGMRKRVGFARGIMLDPELILFDEPSAGLDPVISGVVDELIIDLTQKIGATSVIVTHEMESAFRIATRMAMLYEGRIVADSTPEHFKNHENEVVAQFVSGSSTGPILENSK